MRAARLPCGAPAYGAGRPYAVGVPCRAGAVAVRAQAAVKPPSAATTEPVMKPERAEARKPMISAISAG